MNNPIWFEIFSRVLHCHGSRVRLEWTGLILAQVLENAGERLQPGSFGDAVQFKLQYTGGREVVARDSMFELLLTSKKWRLQSGCNHSTAYVDQWKG